jgi:7,8-dihydropterin-6-yl-methyl-4-(beta-D-ribofuranosyl)aminobenzene 5'-phosphate synthase
MEIVMGDRVYLVIGGFHLSGTSFIQIESIIDSFEQLAIKKVAPCHCSGAKAHQLFAAHYGNSYIESGGGKRISLPQQQYRFFPQWFSGLFSGSHYRSI